MSEYEGKYDTSPKRKRPLIYVAGPYRALRDELVLENIHEAWLDAVKLWRAGAAVICPHTNTTDSKSPFLNAGVSAKDFIEGDLVMIERCDAIYMRLGWENSVGAREECNHAIAKQIPVYKCMDDLVSDIKHDGIGDLAELQTRKSCNEDLGTEFGPVRLAGVHSSIDTCIASDKGNPKDAAGSAKTPYHLVPESATAQEAEVMRLGASKYGAYNWRSKAVKASIYVDALRRHMAAWFDREDDDLESGLSHLAHARANLGILLDADHCGKLIDDRPIGTCANRDIDPDGVQR